LEVAFTEQVPTMPRRRRPHPSLGLPRAPARRLALALPGALACLLAAPSDAHAQFIQRFALRGEAGIGTMLSDYQRNTSPGAYGGNAMGYDNLNIQATVRLAFTIVDPLAVQLSFANGFFPTSTQSGTGRLMAFEAGLRFEPHLGRVGRLFLDGNAGYALTGPLERAELNAGLGFEFDLSQALALGPVVRLHDVLQPGTVSAAGLTTYDSDATYWSAGVSISLRVPPPAPPPPPPPPPPPAPLDTDCDGVLDPDDLCPTVPRGHHPDLSRLGCPLSDVDHDGVYGSDDVCPTVPAGDYPDASRLGCPDPDRDHDGVANELDQCPIQPAGPTPDPARPGCPDPHPIAVLESSQIRINQQVHFDTRSANIVSTNPATTRENQEILDQVVSVLRFHGTITRLEVQGHTDNVCRACPGGPRAYNLALSERRAESIRAYLVEHGIDANRLTSRGYGQGSPLEDNATPAGRLSNRRVEFHILETAPGAPPPAPPGPVEPHPLPPAEPEPVAPAEPCRVQPTARPS
jgi:outer membrane protein OmpA-like peptidoglycan-associated protein